MMRKEQFLKSIIEEIMGYSSDSSFPKISQFEIEYAGLDDEILDIYKKLGGIQESFPINYSWDIKYPDFIIELDEELHFNRYRLITLNSSIYNSYRYFSIGKYKEYCRLYENNCLSFGKYGNKWMSNSSEKFFLKSNDYGVLEGNGSSRWRQRAFNDFLKDVNSVIRNKPVIRVSIYDEYDGETIGSILNRRDRKKTTDFVYSVLKEYKLR